MHTGYRHLVYGIPAIAALVLVVIFATVSPIALVGYVGLTGILLVFLLLYICITGVLFIILHEGAEIMLRIVTRHGDVSARRWRLEMKRAYYVASVVALAPLCLLAMQSQSQLQFRDVLLVMAMTIVATFYVLKRNE